MKYLAVLGRQPEISAAELEAQLLGLVWLDVMANECRVFSFSRQLAAGDFNIDRFGGMLKMAVQVEQGVLDYLRRLPEGKITLGVSDYSRRASQKSAQLEALKLKKILVRHGRSVRVVENKTAVLSTATSLHNGLSGKNVRKVELIKVDKAWYRVIGVQDIDAYARRDQARPARDAKVGMLPPKLAQILINLCGPLPEGVRILDPFCGTGVVLQEALLMGYQAYGTDVSERMVEYTEKNLNWLSMNSPVLISSSMAFRSVESSRAWSPFDVAVGNATSFTWKQPIDAVACEGYLGKPMSQIPSEMKLKEQKQECSAIIMGFLKNLAAQIKSGTPVTIAVPAWLRPGGTYERLEMFDFANENSGVEVMQDGRLSSQEKVDEIDKLGYNVNNRSREGLLYYREGQVVARDIIILRKK